MNNVSQAILSRVKNKRRTPMLFTDDVWAISKELNVSARDVRLVCQTLGVHCF
jgi:hypothetical protein